MSKAGYSRERILPALSEPPALAGGLVASGGSSPTVKVFFVRVSERLKLAQLFRAGKTIDQRIRARFSGRQTNTPVTRRAFASTQVGGVDASRLRCKYYPAALRKEP